MLTVRRQHDGLTVASQVEVAESLTAQIRGLLGRDCLTDGQGLLIRGCSSVHTLFMRFAVDVVYFDSNNRVVGIDTNLKPWRVGGLFWGAKHVLELQCNTAGFLKKGDKLEFIEESA